MIVAQIAEHADAHIFISEARTGGQPAKAAATNDDVAVENAVVACEAYDGAATLALQPTATAR